jgi:protein-tyrosine-phosphatase
MPHNTLFLCTGNSARSILAEAILNRIGGERFHAWSAGSQPKGEINPYALMLLKHHGFDTSGLRSKSWNEFAGASAPKLDFVITVCDSAAGEACPQWPGQPMTAQWGMPDPAAVQGTPDDSVLAFAETYRRLQTRLDLFCRLTMAGLDRLLLQPRVAEIGKAQ